MLNLYNVLSMPTAILGLRLWIVICVAIAASLLLLLLLLFILCGGALTSSRRPHRRPPHNSKPLKLHLQDPNPAVSKEILEVSRHPPPTAVVRIDVPKDAVVLSANASPPPPLASTSGTTASSESTKIAMSGGGVDPEVSRLGWGRWFTLREVEEATGGLAEESVIGEGGYGIVYRGVLEDNTIVAIKNLLNNRDQAGKEFKVEVEAIGRVRHKNLVKLLGYCIEGSYRMLVYEYVHNGTLEQWLHGDEGKANPLTWDNRMKIILGTAKGLAYLHDGLEPKVVHRDVKSSNILLDQQWNPKVSDFGLAKLLQSERSYVTTRVMGTFGYVAPEYASTGMLNETSDVYSFGILIMEIISGRTPVDFARTHGQVYMVEWLKTMVGEKKSEEVVDPRMPEKPPVRALKRALLLALRCIDPDAQKRPKMGHVVHMLEMDDLLFQDDRKLGQQECSLSLERYDNGSEGKCDHYHYHYQSKRRWVDGIR